MSYSRPVRTGNAFPPSNTPWTVRRRNVAAPVETAGPPLNRRYNVSWLTSSGEIEDFSRMGPSIPLFRDAFTAIARGSLVPTDEGHVAIEDLLPGTMIQTVHGARPLMWKGSTGLAGQSPERQSPQGKLYRVPADAFGMGRPLPDLVLGPSARLVNRSPALRAAMTADVGLVPIAPMTDGMSVIEVTPVAPVEVFHLGFARHCLLAVNGVEIESFHPGQIDSAQLGRELTDRFLALFPHIRGLSGFGKLCCPRVTSEEYDTIQAA